MVQSDKDAAKGNYEISYDMADITENHEEDKARWFAYAQQGYIPFWRYLVKFEGMTEDEAKEIVQEQEDKMKEMQMGLFAQ